MNQTEKPSDERNPSIEQPKEKLTQQKPHESIEDIDRSIGRLLEEESILFKKYIELYGDPDENNQRLAQLEYKVVAEANCGQFRKLARNQLENFIKELKTAIEEKGGSL